MLAAALPHGLDVRDFHAVGDGKTDSTAAIQKALDKAAKTNGTVFIPEGVFVCSTLKMPPHVGLRGNPTWEYGRNYGSVLRLGDSSARCLLDVTAAYGFRIHGLCLDGADLGKDIHGIMVDKPDYGERDATIFFENCRISHFSGDGLHLSRIWVFSIRHCMIAYNKGCGFRFRGWDGFVIDNWFSGNGVAGICAYEENAACTFTANRIEWNPYGMIFKAGHGYNITGNYFDRNSGPGLAVLPGEGHSPGKAMTITGNYFHRSGAPDVKPFADPYQNTHLRFENAEGLTCVGNTFEISDDDKGHSILGPDYSMVLKGLSHSVVANNVMLRASLKQLIVDLGGHGEGFILKDNPGSLWKKKPQNSQSPQK